MNTTELTVAKRRFKIEVHAVPSGDAVAYDATCWAIISDDPDVQTVEELDTEGTEFIASSEEHALALAKAWLERTYQSRS